MTNEIKEILDEIQEVAGYSTASDFVRELDSKDCNLLLDYITNLQEENERLKLNQTKKVFDTIAGLIKNGETCSYRYLIYDLLGFQEKDYVDLMSGLAITNMLVDYEDYKQRIDKAVEYCNNNIEFTPRLLDIIDILRGDE